MTTDVMSKTTMLRQVAVDYVLKGLGAKDFDSILYDENVVLRAPICPGGSAVPLMGRENLRQQWWAPLPSLLGKVTLIDSFVNEATSSAAVEFHCEILQPACTLRIIDRFKINEEGKIIEQENFFDPRGITNPA